MVRHKASLTVYMAIVMTLLVSLLVTLIEHVRVTSAIASIDIISSMSVVSAFGMYDRDLFEEYGLLMLAGNKEDLANSIIEYADANTEYRNPFLNVQLKNVETQKIYRPNYMEGALVEKQVFDYMKYAAPLGMGADLVNVFTKNVDDNPVKKVTGSIMDLSEDMNKISPNMYRLIMFVDGVLMDEKGMHGVVPTFAKMISTDDSTSGLGIEKADVYEGVKQYIYNPLVDLLVIRSLVLQRSDENKLRNTLSSYKDKLKIVCDYYDNAISTARQINDDSKSVENKTKEIQAELDEYKGKLDDDMYKGLCEELKHFQSLDTKDNNGVCDIADLMVKLERNKNQLLNALLITDIATDKLHVEDIDRAIALFSEYRVNDICFDYGSINANGTENQTMSILDSIYGLNILDLVKDDVSKKALPYRYSASYQSEAPYSGAEGLMRNALFSEYVLNKFNSATDSKTEYPIDYEVEYIMYGNNKDRDNLALVVKDIIGIREAANLLYLFTDVKKMDESYKLALSIVGGLGNPALLRTTQLAILSVWAYAESIVDARTLLQGKRLDFYKTSATWVVSLENLLKLKLEGSGKDSKTGNDYEDYIRYLMIGKKYGQKNMGLLSLIEIHKQVCGDENFSLGNMLVASTVTLEYSYMNNKSYKRVVSYSY